jgi:hypothetical protein
MSICLIVAVLLQWPCLVLSAVNCDISVCLKLMPFARFVWTKPAYHFHSHNGLCGFRPLYHTKCALELPKFVTVDGSANNSIIKHLSIQQPCLSKEKSSVLATPTWYLPRSLHEVKQLQIIFRNTNDHCRDHNDPSLIRSLYQINPVHYYLLMPLNIMLQSTFNSSNLFLSLSFTRNHIHVISGARGSVMEWGFMLQERRSLLRFPMR